MSSLTARAPPIQHDPTLERSLIVGPDQPEQPFPVYLDGWVTRGFGRGSKDLGCPTANLPDSSIAAHCDNLSAGVYYGYASVHLDDTVAAASEAEVHPMVMSIGWNPQYDNDTRTAEVHILHDYGRDFYGREMRVVMLGWIRPEYKYASFDALIKDINFDKEVAAASAARPAYKAYADDEYFKRACTLTPPERDPALPRVPPAKEPVTIV